MAGIGTKEVTLFLSANARLLASDDHRNGKG